VLVYPWILAKCTTASATFPPSRSTFLEPNSRIINSKCLFGLQRIPRTLCHSANPTLGPYKGSKVDTVPAANWARVYDHTTPEWRMTLPGREGHCWRDQLTTSSVSRGNPTALVRYARSKEPPPPLLTAAVKVYLMTQQLTGFKWQRRPLVTGSVWTGSGGCWHRKSRPRRVSIKAAYPAAGRGSSWASIWAFRDPFSLCRVETYPKRVQEWTEDQGILGT
jgi:hypothetical protein